MVSKFQSFQGKASLSIDFEGAITSSANIRPDEVILKNFDSNAMINIIFSDGKSIDLPIHRNPHEKTGTLVIPEKCYKDAEHDAELSQLLSTLFDNQRKFEIEINEQDNKIIIQPVGPRKSHFKISFVR